jgi:hypothetical protein
MKKGEKQGVSHKEGCDCVSRVNPYKIYHIQRVFKSRSQVLPIPTETVSTFRQTSGSIRYTIQSKKHDTAMFQVSREGR